MEKSIEEIAFTIIAIAGSAKSNYIEAIEKAKAGQFEEAKALHQAGRTLYTEAHQAHFSLITKEAQGDGVPFSLLFMHAEDQLLNTETIELMASQLIDVYERLG